MKCHTPNSIVRKTLYYCNNFIQFLCAYRFWENNKIELTPTPMMRHGNFLKIQISTRSSSKYLLANPTFVFFKSAVTHTGGIENMALKQAKIVSFFMQSIEISMNSHSFIFSLLISSNKKIACLKRTCIYSYDRTQSHQPDSKEKQFFLYTGLCFAPSYL